MHNRRLFSVAAVIYFLAMAVSFADARVDVATLTPRREVQATVYDRADLTLIRDRRMISLSKGINDIQFSWANTNIDPTSLNLEIIENQAGAQILEIVYPAETRQMGIWRVKAQSAAPILLDITYFTSGIRWHSAYTLLLSQAKDTCTLSNTIDIKNTSGEDYNALSVRLVVGQVNLLDEIARLSSRPYPYDRPLQEVAGAQRNKTFSDGVRMMKAAAPMQIMTESLAPEPAQVRKKAVSQYFLYAIDGLSTLKDGWTNRLLSFESRNVPVSHVFRYDTARYGSQVIHLLDFENSRKNRMGETPLPGGAISVFWRTDDSGGLSFAGKDTIDYIPVNKKVSLNLGPASQVKIKPKVMAYRRENLKFDRQKNLTGFTETRLWEVTVSNLYAAPVFAEYIHHIDIDDYAITKVSHPDSFKKIDKNTVGFTLSLTPGEKQIIHFNQTGFIGDR